MSTEKMHLRPAGKGFVLAASGGLPPMRRLVQAFTGRNNEKYIKLDGEISPLLPRHMYLCDLTSLCI